MQQRMVHRQDFSLPEAESTVEELSVDGGNIRIRTPKGQPCDWKGYKAVCLHEVEAVAASFQDNGVVIDWVNAQPLGMLLTCLGDGHDGIWNIISQLAPNTQRREVLDWFHLNENRHLVGGSFKRLNQAEKFLWQGQVEAAKALFADCKLQQAQNFCKYHGRASSPHHQLRVLSSRADLLHWFGCSGINDQAN